MEPKRISKKTTPEAKTQEELITFLKLRDWSVKSTHGNLFQYGLPDLYCAHLKFGPRWIEVKNIERYSFTKAQRIYFPELASKGVGVWVLVAATQYEYEKLFCPANYWFYF